VSNLDIILNYVYDDKLDTNDLAPI